MSTRIEYLLYRCKNSTLYIVLCSYMEAMLTSQTPGKTFTLLVRILCQRRRTALYTYVYARVMNILLMSRCIIIGSPLTQLVVCSNLCKHNLAATVLSKTSEKNNQKKMCKPGPIEIWNNICQTEKLVP